MILLHLPPAQAVPPITAQPAPARQSAGDDGDVDVEAEAVGEGEGEGVSDPNMFCFVPLSPALVAPPSTAPATGRAWFSHSNDDVVLTVQHSLTDANAITINIGDPGNSGALVTTLPTASSPSFLLMTRSEFAQIHEGHYIQVNNAIYPDGALRGDVACQDIFSCPNGPLRVATAPSNLVVAPGNVATFHMHVADGCPPISFQWFKNSVALTSGGNIVISGFSAESSLSIFNISEADEATYTCRARDGFLGDVSASATLGISPFWKVWENWSKSLPVYISHTGSDDTGDGSPARPLQTISTAMQYALTLASAELPVVIHVGAGVYQETVTIPSFAWLSGPAGQDRGEAIIQPTQAQLQQSGGVAIEMSSGTKLSNLTVMVDSHVTASGVKLVQLRNDTAAVDNVILNGLSRAQSVGVDVLPGAVNSSITRCLFRRLAFGARTQNASANISRNDFEYIEDDGIVIVPPDAKGGTILSPVLGDSTAKGATGYNIFRYVEDRYIDNQSGTAVLAEGNDWGRYDNLSINEKMTGPTDYEPFLSQYALAEQHTVEIVVVDMGTGMPLFHPVVSLSPSALPEQTDNVDGIYRFELVPAGSYIAAADAQGYLPHSVPFTILEGTNAIVKLTIAVQKNPGFIFVDEPEQHSGDANNDGKISMVELLRVIQFYNAGPIRCLAGAEDGYAIGHGNKTCPPHAADFLPINWRLSLSEVLRIVQFYSYSGYHSCPESEDGYCPGTASRL